MAQPTNTFDTYDQIGIREDLSDMIWNISPTETPFCTGARKGKATNTYHEWQTDALAAAADDNAHIEGDDTSADASTPTVRLGNYTQIFKKSARVTGTGNAVKTAGRSNEMAYQVAKRTKELKRDMEASMLANQARVTGDSSTARRLAGVPSWIATNTNFDTSDGVDPSGDGTDARTDGTSPRAFTEAQLKDVLQQCWDEGGNPDTIMVGGSNKQVASTFDGGTTKFDRSEDKRLTAAIDYYVSDFGELKIVPNRFQRSRDALILEMDMWEVAALRPMRNEELAKTGDSEIRQILGEYTLKARNEASSGIVADLT